jgi:4-hydroxy-tetrahydrodipicolinate synthase
MTASTTPLERGVWGILATPFSGPQLDIDVASLHRQIELYREIGARGVVALGVFGEAGKLDAAEQRRVIEATGESAGGLGVVIGLTPLATAPAIAQARAACTGVGDDLTGVMVQVNAADPQVVVPHLRAIHEATGAGIVLQDYPRISGVHIAAEQLLEVLRSCPFVVAIKAEAPPTSTAVAALAADTTVPVFGGLGGVGLLDELAAGAAGAMTGFSHPEGLIAVVDAHQEGGFAAAREAFAPWLPIANFEGQEGIGLAIRKQILQQRGIIAEAGIRRPGRPFPEALRPLLQSHLAALQPLSKGS